MEVRIICWTISVGLTVYPRGFLHLFIRLLAEALVLRIQMLIQESSCPRDSPRMRQSFAEFSSTIERVSCRCAFSGSERSSAACKSPRTAHGCWLLLQWRGAALRSSNSPSPPRPVVAALCFVLLSAAAAGCVA